MSDFRIVTSENEPVLVTERILPAFKQHMLCKSKSYMSHNPLGDMLFQHFTGNEFEIWYCHFLMRKAASFIGTANSPVLELQIPLVNEFQSSWDGMEHIEMRTHQFEMTYTPFVKTRSKFSAETNYQTFDIHFTIKMLEPYAMHCRKLSLFLENVLKNQPANLLDMIQYISVDMLRIIKSIINYQKADNLCEIYFDALICEFMTLLTIQVGGLTDKPKFSASEIRHATEARKIIMADFENNYTIAELAKMTGTTELRLQIAFKHLFGITVYKFSKQARLQHAYSLLQTTNHPLRVICMMVGYPDAANFAIAFKNEYGVNPGKVQKG